jgi:hypothetical protein
MQSKLKYKLYGEFDDYEINELRDWFVQTLDGANLNKSGSIKVTIDWEDAGNA